jgi:tetratricopeptide (TPR) repeat protein
VFLEGRIVICLAVALAAFLIYGRTVNFSFVEFDDPGYVYQNTHVRPGLTISGIAWAFTSVYGANWHPLTWISHMIDVELFGLNPGMHHMVNVFFHAINGILLFLVLDSMTSERLKSALVALLFMVHPLHVESVAWISERKDVLSTMFWMLAMGAYLGYARRPAALRYLLVAMLFTLGLMAKPMLVTLPFVLLLLDFWPLDRAGILNKAPEGARPPGRGIPKTSIPRLLLEKAPLVILSLASSAVTIYAQSKGHTVRTLEELPMGLRLGNSLVAYATYLAKTFIPRDLAAFYPFPARLGLMELAASVAFLAGISTLCAIHWKKRPYLAAGWLWYLGSLVPVIGLVQVGRQSMADRYTYVPLVGVFVMLVWGLSEAGGKTPAAKKARAAVSAMALLICALLAYRQAGTWSNSETLFRHMLASTSGNYLAHYNLGCVFQEKKEYVRAMVHYEEALSIKPDLVDARNNLAGVLLEKGRLTEAIRHYMISLKYEQDQARVCNNLGTAYFRLGELNRALEFFRRACSADPHYVEARKNLEGALTAKRRVKERLDELLAKDTAADRDPELLVKIGEARRMLGDIPGAEKAYLEALRLDKHSQKALRGLISCARATSNDSEEIARLEKLADLDPKDPGPCYDIACIHARSGRKAKAVAWLQKAVERGFSDWDLLATDSDLIAARDHPYVAGLLKRRLPQARTG